MNPLKELQRYGQSIWLDYIRRSLVNGGELKRLIEEEGLSGVTSNPTIFEKAIAESADYGSALKALLSREPRADAARLYQALVVEDIRMAADLLRPVYEASGGADGFVSVEVSPHLSRDTAGTIAEAGRWKSLISRPNLMIKVPATAGGIPAIEALIAEGINVNVTLMFSLGHYEAVAGAYLRGLERCPEPRAVGSVASFFVSRVDTLVDRALERIGQPEALALRGKIAVANAKVVYRRFRETFDGPPFSSLRNRGARPQRLLWASTGTKNPSYSDVLYVENLIGPDTVNTLPPATLAAFNEHGRARAGAVEEGLDEAESALERLSRFGIEMGTVGEQLQAEGLEAFSVSFDKLLAALEEKRHAILSGEIDRQRLSLGKGATRVEERSRSWEKSRFGCRFWQKDPTLWSPRPVAELSDRLGWLTLPERMQEQVHDLKVFAEEAKAEGIRHVVLLGMGGSSLAPEVFQRSFGNQPGHPELAVLDSTHPTAVRAVEMRADLNHTLFLVSSKSGTTTETLSLFYYFWHKASEWSDRASYRFVAITDPGTPLEALARERHFRRTFRAAADVGGRYSALTLFGLVPAALIGLDIEKLLDQAWVMAEASAFCVADSANPALTLGAALGEMALAGRDKVTLVTSPALRPFPTWVEQLIAESTGKDGKGIIPVIDEPPGGPASYGADRLFVYLRLEPDDNGPTDEQMAACAPNHPVVRIDLKENYDLGQEFFRWEMAVAAAGAVLGIHPFNQPDVQLAKELSHKAMEAKGKAGSASAPAEVEGIESTKVEELKRRLASFLKSVRLGDYVALQAYLAPTEESTAILQQIRLKLRERLRVATTLGYGPRFLHSTGQLHKGGPAGAVILQLVDEPGEELAVPETDYSFGKLIEAQAIGDYQALRERGRRVLRINLGGDPIGGSKRLLTALGG